MTEIGGEREKERQKSEREAGMDCFCIAEH